MSCVPPTRRAASARCGSCVVARDRVLELAHPAAERAADLRQPLRRRRAAGRRAAGGCSLGSRSSSGMRRKRSSVWPHARGRKTVAHAKKPLAEQVVVVTGASAGLGRAIAPAGGGSRARSVVVAARGGDALDATRRELEALGRRGDRGARPTSRRSTTCHRVVEQAVDRFGRIDTYCRERDGHRLRRRRASSSPTSCGACSTSTSSAPVYGYWASLPHLTESRGTFVHVSSALAYRGIPLQAAYCSSKAAAARLLRVRARRASRSTGSRSTSRSSCPAAINTPQFDRGAPVDRQAAAAGAADLPAGAVRRGRAALLRAPDPRAAGRLGRAEAPLGPEALAARRRPRAAAERLERPAHGRGQAGRLARQPLRAAARRPRRPRPLRRRSRANAHALDVAAPAPRGSSVPRPSGVAAWLRMGVDELADWAELGSECPHSAGRSHNHYGNCWS